MNFLVQLMLICACTIAHGPREATTSTDTSSRPQDTIDQMEGLPSNFRFHGFTDESLLNAVKCGAVDMLRLAYAALAAADESSSSFLRYFQKEDLDSVLEIFDKIIAESALVDCTDAQIVDFYFHIWDKLPPKTTKCPDKKNLLAFAVEGIVTPGDKNIILCTELFKNNPRCLADITCDSLGKTATWKSMDTIASSILHETLHLESLMGRTIDDVHVKVDGLGYIPGYGPYAAMMVNRVDQLGILNADNYVWFAMEAWFMEQCKLKGFADPPIGVIKFDR